MAVTKRPYLLTHCLGADCEHGVPTNHPNLSIVAVRSPESFNGLYIAEQLTALYGWTGEGSYNTNGLATLVKGKNSYTLSTCYLTVDQHDRLGDTISPGI